MDSDMNGSDKLKSVQGKIGKVQDQMKDNIEMALNRQENVDSLADKSSSLQVSANQFSQVASRIREDQQLQQYKFYGMIVLGFAFFLVIVLFWGSPAKMILGLAIVAFCGVLFVYLLRARRESSVRLADSYAQHRDVEIGDDIIE